MKHSGFTNPSWLESSQRNGNMPESLIILICEHNHKSRFSSEEGLALLPIVRVQFCSGRSKGKYWVWERSSCGKKEMLLSIDSVSKLFIKRSTSSICKQHPGAALWCQNIPGSTTSISVLWRLEFYTKRCGSISGCRHSKFAMSRTRGKSLYARGKQSYYMSLKVFRMLSCLM